MTTLKKPSTAATEIHIRVSPDKFETSHLQAMEILDTIEQAVLGILEEKGIRNSVAVSSTTGEPIYRVGGYKTFNHNPLLERMLVGSSVQLKASREHAEKLYSPRLVDEVCYHEY